MYPGERSVLRVYQDNMVLLTELNNKLVTIRVSKLYFKALKLFTVANFRYRLC